MPLFASQTHSRSHAFLYLPLQLPRVQTWTNLSQNELLVPLDISETHFFFRYPQQFQYHSIVCILGSFSALFPRCGKPRTEWNNVAAHSKNRVPVTAPPLVSTHSKNKSISFEQTHHHNKLHHPFSFPSSSYRVSKLTSSSPVYFLQSEFILNQPKLASARLSLDMKLYYMAHYCISVLVPFIHFPFHFVHVKADASLKSNTASTATIRY